jgi:transcriptional regulator with XRE-family HTH domain
MNRKDLLKDIGYRLKKVREALNNSGPQMASEFGVMRSSYLRNESGKTCPGIMSMRILGNRFNISLDWLICEKGPMYYREKEQKHAEKVGESQEAAKAALEVKPAPETLDSLPEDIRELLDHMKRIPLLRYETLASFHKFKQEYKEMVSAAMV